MVYLCHLQVSLVHYHIYHCRIRKRTPQKIQNIPPIAKEHHTADGKKSCTTCDARNGSETGIKTTFWASHFKTRAGEGDMLPCGIIHSF